MGAAKGNQESSSRAQSHLTIKDDEVIANHQGLGEIIPVDKEMTQGLIG